MKDLKEAKLEQSTQVPQLSEAPVDAAQYIYCATFRGPVILSRVNKKDGGSFLLLKTLGGEFFVQDKNYFPEGCYNKMEVELLTGKQGMQLGGILNAA